MGTVFNVITRGFMPVLNALFMWTSAAGKKHLADTIQKIAPHHHDIDQVNGDMTSGNQDILCGTNSALLMLRQVLSVFHPTLAKVAEPMFAPYISLRSYLEGSQALKGISHEEVHNGNGKYGLNFFDRTFGSHLYNLAREISGFMNVKLPKLSELQALKKNPEHHLAA